MTPHSLAAAAPGITGVILRVALDVPLRRLFDYLPPRARADGVPTRDAELRPGVRVRVPFGRQRLVGLVMEIAADSEIPVDRLKPAFEVLDTAPLVDAAALALLRWAADYYHQPLGQAVAVALPKGLRLGAPVAEIQPRWTATDDGIEAYRRGDPVRAPQQRRLLGLLVEGPGGSEGKVDPGPGGQIGPDVCPATGPGAGFDAATLNAALPGWRDAARALVRRGWSLCRLAPRSGSADAAAWHLARARSAGLPLTPH
ncbi:MAG: hypothetical protein ACREUG_19120, partial [Steroidobacteraceae bacterium]